MRVLYDGPLHYTSRLIPPSANPYLCITLSKNCNQKILMECESELDFLKVIEIMKVKKERLSHVFLDLTFHFQFALCFHSSYTNARAFTNMNQEMEFKLSDFEEVNSNSNNIGWNARSVTKIAISSGKLPITSNDLEWRPLFAPGLSGASIRNSKTISGLVKRAKIGGEA